jgi:hypothetical protein
MIWIVFFAASIAAGWLLGQGDAAANARAAADHLSQDGTGAMLGATLGLYARDRIRLRRAYASPAAAWLGKRLLGTALAAAATYAFSPVAWPAASTHAFAAAAAVGAAVWIGNLPPRL